MTIIFRADSSSTIGTGHIMRDLVLAKQYKGSTIIFATQNLQGNLNSKILESGYSVEILNDNSLDEFQKVMDRYSPDLVVIDSYNIDYDFEKKLKTQNPKLKLLSFDDTYEKHYCDILLNHNISANEKRYEELVPYGCELKCGSKYTLIRDEFIKEKKEKRIFIAMGGADSENISLKILKILSKYENIKVHLITTNANPNIDILKTYIKKKKIKIKLHINSTKLAKLMKKSDFAIVSPSVIVHEVLFMELPFIAIKTAYNQNDIYEYLKRNGYFCISSVKESEQLKKYLKEFL